MRSFARSIDPGAERITVYPAAMVHPFSGLGSLVFAVGLLLAPARAANSAPAVTGNIAGRIHNIVTGQYLNNARVTVRGSDQVAFTDSSGSYRLAGVPAGLV